MRLARHRMAMVFTVAMAALPRASAAQSATEVATGATMAVASGATVQLRAVNGEASFVTAPGDQVVIEYARAVPADVKVVSLATAEGLTICTVYTSSDPKKPTDCLPGGKGRLSSGKAKEASRVQLRIRVPAGVHVSATIDQGDLKAAGITGNLRLYSSNGDLVVNDAGGPGTVFAGVGMLGNIDAEIAKSQNGPTLREIQLAAAGSGRVRVAMPTTVGASYRITSQRPPVIDPVFGTRNALIGHLGPAGDSAVRLSVDTGIAGQFTLLPAK